MSKHYLRNKIDEKYPYITNNGSCNYTTMGVEITFDQFKRHVFQDIDGSKEVIPEYVECISWVGNSFTPSKIYKVVNGKVKDNDGDHDITDWNHVCFKPSSKSAFDAQNQSKQLSEQTANNISETIDIVRYMTMQTNQSDMLENALKSFTCEIQQYDYEFLAQMNGGKVSKVNKVQISTDNEIRINIIQKQSIKI